MWNVKHASDAYVTVVLLFLNITGAFVSSKSSFCIFKVSRETVRTSDSSGIGSSSKIALQLCDWLFEDELTIWRSSTSFFLSLSSLFDLSLSCMYRSGPEGDSFIADIHLKCRTGDSLLIIFREVSCSIRWSASCAELHCKLHSCKPFRFGNMLPLWWRIISASR